MCNNTSNTKRFKRKGTCVKMQLDLESSASEKLNWFLSRASPIITLVWFQRYDSGGKRQNTEEEMENEGGGYVPLFQYAAHYLLHNISNKAEIQKCRESNTEIQRGMYIVCCLPFIAQNRNTEIQADEDMCQYACYLFHNIPTKAKLLLEPLISN